MTPCVERWMTRDTRCAAVTEHGSPMRPAWSGCRPLTHFTCLTSIAGESRRDPRSPVNSPRLRAARLCSVRVMLSRPSRPSIESARKEEGENPRAFNQLGTRPPSRCGDARRSTAPAPQSKPVTHASRLVAHIAPSVASGLGLRILAAEPAAYRLYSDRGHLCEPTPKSLLGLVRGRGVRSRREETARRRD